MPGKSSLKILAMLALSSFAMTGTAFADKSDNTFSFVSRAPINNLDPYYNSAREGQTVYAEMVFDSLVWTDGKTAGEFQPLLAESWEWVDATTMAFKLREGVKWHNGEPFTADDVVYTLSHRMLPDSRVSVPLMVSWIAGVEKTGDYSVNIKLKAPMVSALEYLSKLPILRKDLYAAGQVAPSPEAAVGTGPYKVTEFVPGTSLTMEINENYFAASPKGQPRIGKITYRSIPDPATQIAELMSGGTDWLWYVPADQVENLRTVPGIEIAAPETMRFTFLTFDSQRNGGPMADYRVRSAIAHAIDRETIATSLFGSNSIVKSACYETMTGCDTDVQQYGYDPELAKSLLAEAGFADGLSITMKGWRSRDWLSAVAGYLGAVGIEASVESVPYPVAVENISAGTVDVTMQEGGWNSINDVSRVVNDYFGGQTLDSAKDPEIIRLVGEAAGETDPVKRDALYSTILNMIADKMYLQPMWSHPNFHAFKEGLVFDAGYDENPRFYSAYWK